MRVVQFESPTLGRRVGVVQGDLVVDITAAEGELTRVYDVFQRAELQGVRFEELLNTLVGSAKCLTLSYAELHAGTPAGSGPFLRPPLDCQDPHRVLVTGTGLTHTGSMQSRNQMHTTSDAPAKSTDEPQTPSAAMFAMGLQGGKPPEGERGVAPEWFYKGDGGVLRGHHDDLELPAFALDGGEEPELVGCYIIDGQGVPRRLGFALGNEWSDHATERINYLYLAPSKLRTCAVGPELNTEFAFDDLALRCRVQRDANELYDSGELRTGEDWMCHSLANCEDHHFKYAQHRRPGDVHLHFFGTSKLSYSEREWKFAAGDEIEISAPNFGASLVNRVKMGNPAEGEPVCVKPA